MTPPIGFRTGSPHDSPDFPAPRGASIADPASSSLIAHSPAADYAYRIAALTAGLALIVTFL